MNKIEQPERRRSITWMGAMLTAILMIVLGQSGTANAQWATNGNDINNTNTGSVGIGTTTPAVDANGATNLTLDGSAKYGEISIGRYQLTTTAPIGGLNFFNSALSGTEKRVAAIWGSTDGATNSGSLQFYTFNSGAIAEAMRINKNGNIGIGTTTPGDKLTVYGSNIKSIFGDSTTHTNLYSTYNSQSWNAIEIYTNGGIGSHLVFTNNVTSGAIGGITFANKGAGTEGVSDLRVAGWFAYTDGAANKGYLNFWTSNGAGLGERMRITNVGNVGIGTTTPAYKLDVNGSINATAIYQNGVLLGSGGGGGTITGVTAGAGLTGGGTSGAVTLDIGAGTGLSVAADSLSVNYGATAGTAVQGNTSVTVSPGTGMSGGGSLTLGGGGTVTLNNADGGSSQAIFKQVANAAGTAQFSAGTNNDTLRFEGTGGTSVSFDAATKKVVINSSTSGSTVSAANVSAGQFAQSTGGGDFTFPGNVIVTGNIAAKYQDVAEWVPAAHALPAATVVVLDPSRANQVQASAKAYDTRVAGVISAQPGLVLGVSAPDKVLVATTGRVRVKVDARRAPIHIGDLLVTSDEQGMAMRSEPLNLGGAQIHRPGTLIGKALQPLESGVGEILVLLSLQ
jgi:hypothetical protein